MLTASLIGTALVFAALIGASVTAYLWHVYRPKLEVSTGIKALAAMRWREFSRFVIDGLRSQGFAPSLAMPSQGGQEEDLLLTRDDQTWLLGCKQGADQVITANQVDDLARSVRQAGAGGGLLATLGKIDPEARANTPGIQLLDGAALWTMIQTVLPQSLRDDLARHARARTMRSIQLAWLGSLLIGFALAMWLPPRTTDATAGRPPVPEAEAPTDMIGDAARTAAATDTAPPAAPLATPQQNEDQRRDEAMRAIATLPGFEKAMWATRSTLVVYLAGEEAGESDVAALCRTLERYDELRASRLQLQPPAGSDKPVRFIQCHVY